MRNKLKDLFEKMLTQRYDAILSGKLNNQEVMQLLKEVKLILDIKKEID